MNRVKRVVLVLVAAFTLLFGAITVYAVSGDGISGDAGASDAEAPASLSVSDCMAEEMEIEAYYMNIQ